MKLRVTSATRVNKSLRRALSSQKKIPVTTSPSKLNKQKYKIRNGLFALHDLHVQHSKKSSMSGIGSWATKLPSTPKTLKLI